MDEFKIERLPDSENSQIYKISKPINIREWIDQVMGNLKETSSKQLKRDIYTYEIPKGMRPPKKKRARKKWMQKHAIKKIYRNAYITGIDFGHKPDFTVIADGLTKAADLTKTIIEGWQQFKVNLNDINPIIPGLGPLNPRLGAMGMHVHPDLDIDVADAARYGHLKELQMKLIKNLTNVSMQIPIDKKFIDMKGGEKDNE